MSPLVPVTSATLSATDGTLTALHAQPLTFVIYSEVGKKIETIYKRHYSIPIEVNNGRKRSWRVNFE